MQFSTHLREWIRPTVSMPITSTKCPRYPFDSADAPGSPASHAFCIRSGPTRGLSGECACPSNPGVPGVIASAPAPSPSFTTRASVCTAMWSTATGRAYSARALDIWMVRNRSSCLRSSRSSSRICSSWSIVAFCSIAASSVRTSDSA